MSRSHGQKSCGRDCWVCGDDGEVKRTRETEEAKLDEVEWDVLLEPEPGYLECTDPRCYICGDPEGGMAEHEATVTFATLGEVLGRTR